MRPVSRTADFELMWLKCRRRISFASGSLQSSVTPPGPHPVPRTTATTTRANERLQSVHRRALRRFVDIPPRRSCGFPSCRSHPRSRRGPKIRRAASAYNRFATCSGGHVRPARSAPGGEAGPVFRRDGPTFVVSPATRDPKVSWREPLETKPERPHYRYGGLVPRLYVRLYPVQGEPPECMLDDECDPFGHQATARVRCASNVAEVGTAEVSAHDLGERCVPDDSARLSLGDEHSEVRRARVAFDERDELLLSRWRSRETPV